MGMAWGIGCAVEGIRSGETPIASDRPLTGSPGGEDAHAWVKWVMHRLGKNTISGTDSSHRHGKTETSFHRTATASNINYSECKVVSGSVDTVCIEGKTEAMSCDDSEARSCVVLPRTRLWETE